MANDFFWRHPPWQKNSNTNEPQVVQGRHRLGMRPVSTPPLAPASVAERRNKLQQLQDHYGQVCATTQHSSAAQQLLTDFWRTQGGTLSDSYPDPIANVAASVGPDLALMDLDDNLRLVAACICAPSYWSLTEKIGHPLAVIHSPVPNLEQDIGALIARFMQQLPADQGFGRRNWFLHADAELFHPFEEGDDMPAVQDWVMRSEFQIMYRLSPRYLLFSIRIVVEPLADIAVYPAARTTLQKALQTMSPAELEHFGGEEKRDALQRWLATC